MPQYWLIEVSGEKEKGTGAPVAMEELVAWSLDDQTELTAEQKLALVNAEAAHFGRKPDAAAAALKQDAGRPIAEAAAKGLLKNSRRILDLDKGKFKAWICWRT